VIGPSDLAMMNPVRAYPSGSIALFFRARPPFYRRATIGPADRCRGGPSTGQSEQNRQAIPLD
jgi:hypothetical protein